MTNYELTETETTVLELLADGLSNPAIAYETNLSRSTVRYHLNNIYGKLGVATRTEAVVEYLAAKPTETVISATPTPTGKVYTVAQIREAAKGLKSLGYDSKTTNALVTDLLALLG